MTAFPPLTGRRLASIVGAAALLTGLLTAPALAANADASDDGTPPITAQTLRQHVSHVRQWGDTHAVPYQPSGHVTQQQYLDYSKQLADYWSDVPWSDYYGQFGCTVKTVDVDFHATDGAWGQAGAESAVSYSCDDDADIATVQPDSLDGVAAPAGAAGSDELPVATQALGADGRILAATVGADPICAKSGSGHVVCISMPTAGALTGQENNASGHSDTGHLRLGKNSLTGSCAAGTLVGTGPTVSVANTKWTSYSHSVNLSGKWSVQWYDPDETSQVCAVY